MRYIILSRVDKKLQKIGKSNFNLLNLVEKQWRIFEKDERHPSLRIHKLKGKLNNYWSLSVGMGIRMIYFIEDNRACFVDIGTHDKVYRLN